MKEKHSLEKVNYLTNLLAFLTAVLILSIYILLEWVNWDNVITPFLKEVLPNIFSVLIAFAIVNFILERKGLTRSQILKDEIIAGINEEFAIQDLKHEIISGIKAEFPITKQFLTGTDAKTKFDWAVELDNKRDIDSCGYSLVSLVEKYRLKIIKAVRDGARLRFIIIEPDSQASNMLLENQRFKVIESHLNSMVEMIQATTQELSEGNDLNNNIGELEIKFINWVPSTTFFISQNNNRAINDCRVSLRFNPPYPKTNWDEIPTFAVLNQKDEGDVVKYYNEQFERLWKDATPLNEVIGKLKKNK